MDLLDSISAMITNTENHKSSGKPKKTNVAKSDTAVSLSKSVVSREQSLQNKKEPVLSKGRNDLITSMNLPVEMNALNIDLSNAPEYVSRYHIDIKKVMQKKKKDATRGPKQDVSTQLRRRALFSVFRQLVTERAEIFGEDSTKHVYDLGNTFYSIGCRIKEQDGDIVLDMKPVFLKRLKQNESETSLREAARFLDVLTSQSLYHSDSHIFENKFFEGSTDNDIKLGEGKCIKSGFEKSIRVVEGGNDMPASLVLQVDRLVVTTTHMNRNRRFFIYGIVENNARNQFFQTTEGSISVEQYFQEKYKLALRYPLLPLVTERQGSTGINFYPLEVLYIEPGQRVENKKLAGRLTEKVIQQTRMLPQEMRNHNIRQLVQANLMNEENQYLNSFGVGIISPSRCFFLIPFPISLFKHSLRIVMYCIFGGRKQ
ncbi:PAZ domain protein [Dictyocaulus viviparus]|uniref:PAZ domain protein n=1 Tax=Dictyocaulus viviparus TaxID=29172 RepID=A0A0D8Y3E8_DICVI|nr:PAZ domain protein [Dictyocaulus viviparus]